MSFRTHLKFWLTAIAIVVVSRDKFGAADEGIAFFEKRIRPALIQHCYECHSAAATEIKGKLRLDSRGAMRQGGESGAAVVPGDAQASLLMDAIRHESIKMPPDKKLAQDTIADFERWINMGAPDPRDRPPSREEAAELSWRVVFESRRDWWSLQPVRPSDPPAVADPAWSDHPLDAFIFSKLADAGLKPAEPAKPRTLIRRLSLVLTGLPPTPAEITAFEDESFRDPQTAIRDLVDRLLDSPHFGERWARHWMDVVRFTETHGNEWNYEVHHAWRYRDYLIRALNGDVPYDQLVREHVAGDLLEPPRWNKAEQFNESIIGTASYRFGEVNHDDCIGLRKIGYDLVDNQLDTLTKAFQATTVACARCHDHKIDAVSTQDYYALLGVLRSSRLVAHTIDAPAVNAERLRRMRELKSEIGHELTTAWLDQAKHIADYLIAADASHQQREGAAKLADGLDPQRLERWTAALAVDAPAVDHPLAPWKKIASSKSPDVTKTWQDLGKTYTDLQDSHRAFNQSNFTSFGDFRDDGLETWHSDGQGLRDGPVSSCELIIAADGDNVLKSIVPAGCYTHGLSEKLNGALRSPPVPAGIKRISFQVLGEHTSAVRLVSNNCQLNYANYRALTEDALAWVTFEIPESADTLRTYAELMTKFDNPKFPDQLGTLGGDKKNDRVPWQEAAADPRSYFGVARAVLHDCAETPRPQLGHLCKLFDGSVMKERATVAQRYATVIADAIRAVQSGRATDEDWRWLDWLIRGGLLDHAANLSPRLTTLVTEYRSIESELSLPRIVPGLADFGDGFDQPLLEEGDDSKPSQPVQRRYLQVLADRAKPFEPRGSGRLAVAEQIAAAENPLTARVMVNRIWHHLFGTGIVSTVDDFGRIGELPSHPELLDHLAAYFVDHDWSIKAMIRYIVLSKTFQMSNLVSDTSAKVDPTNRLLHHYPARRLDAESIRDSLLAASGRLDRTLYGPSVQPYREQPNTDRRLFPGPLDGDGRRSVYVKANLMEAPRFLDAFNFPGGKVARGRRDVTNVPTQALTLLNDPFVRQQAGVWAAGVIGSSTDTNARINQMFVTALGRTPTPAETEDFHRLVEQLAKLHQVGDGQVLVEQNVWQDVAHVFFNLKEFIYIP